MDYEKEYKEALERARNLRKDAIDMGDNLRAKQCEIIFSELKESEDEKIRKDIVSFLKEGKPYHCPNSAIRQEWAAWLEKQDEQKHYSQMEKCINCQFNYTGYCNGTCILREEKVKPKFKVGDWVVDKSGLAQQVLDFRGGIYTCTYNSFTTDCESNYHLWTVQDAKDGDVLQLGEVTAIFKKYIGNEHCTCYCSFCKAGGFEIPIAKEDNVYGCYNATPTTKEQRDLLLQKMKEAGYEWNDEKKELKNICVIDEGKAEMDYCFTKMMNGEKVSSAWSEEDYSKVQRICKYLDEAKKYYADITEIRECIDWLKSLKDRIKGE